MPTSGLVSLFQFKERREDAVEIEGRGLWSSRCNVRFVQQDIDQIHPSPSKTIRLLPRESIAGLLDQLSLCFQIVAALNDVSVGICHVQAQYHDSSDRESRMYPKRHACFVLICEFVLPKYRHCGGDASPSCKQVQRRLEALQQKRSVYHDDLSKRPLANQLTG
jgi:hypothetical protein